MDLTEITEAISEPQKKEQTKDTETENRGN